VADIEKVRIRCRQLLRARPRRLRRDTVCNAYGAATPVVVPGAQPTRCKAEPSVNTESIEELELGQIQSGLLLVNLDHAHEMIENFCHPERRQAGILAS